MSELDREEEAVLDRARRALTPTAMVTRRMRAALLVKLAAPAAAAAGGAAASVTVAETSAQLVEGAASSALASSGSAVASGGALATGAKVLVSAALLKAAAGVTTVAMLTTAAGYYWSAAEAPRVAAPAPSAATVSAPAKRAAPAPPARGVAADPARRSAGARTEPPATEASETAPALGVPHPAPNLGNQQLLQVELDALKRVRQALQAGDTGRALGLLAQLDAEHPVSPLWQEREVARVLALCGAGRVTAAREAARRVLGPNPNSLYAERIQASCAATHVPANAANAAPGESTKSTKVAPPVARFGDSGN